MTTAGWRCFVAVDLGGPSAQRLSELTEPLRRLDAAVRWVRREQLHLTLKFLGDVPEGSIDAVRAALREVRGEGPLMLRIRGLGRFPERGRSRVVWAGLAGDLDAVRRLVEGIETAVEPLGFARERRPFSAHLTLGRVKGPHGIAALEQRLAELSPAVELELPPRRSFRLYRSTLSPSGSTYAVLEEFPLGSDRSG